MRIFGTTPVLWDAHGAATQHELSGVRRAELGNADQLGGPSELELGDK